VVLGASHEHQKNIEKDHLSGVDSIFNYMLSVLLCYTIFPNCFHLHHQKQECDQCLPSRIVARLTHANTNDVPTCCICLEHVYGPTLSCGHVVHNLCLLRMNPLDFFDTNVARFIPRKCPICRRRLSMNDHARVYLLSASVLAKLYR